MNTLTVRAPAQPRRAGAPVTIVAVMTAAALMDMLDVTIVNVALPTLRARLGATPIQLEWLVAGYLLAFGATLIVWGRLGDVLGRRRVFLVSAAAFGAASLAAGTAQSIGWLIAFRVLQGAAAGALVPQVLATFRAALAPTTRAVAFGVYGAVAGLAAAVGVVLGGVLTEYNVLGLGWRAIFLVNVPVAIAVTGVGAAVIPETRPASPRPIDRVAIVLLPGSLAAIVYPILEGRAHRWPVWMFLLLAVGVAGVVATAALESWRSRGADSCAQLLNLEYFPVPAFAAGIGVQALFSASLQGFSLAFVLWLQLGHGYSPIRTGLTLLAFSGGAIVTAPKAVSLARSRGRVILLTGGVLLVAGVCVVAGPSWAGSPRAHLGTSLVGLAIAGAGLGLLVVPLVNVVLAAVPETIAGGAAGVFTTAQQIGGSLGIAVIGAVFFDRAKDGRLTQAFAAAAFATVVGYSAAGLLALVLPREAVSEERAIDIG